MKSESREGSQRFEEVEMERDRGGSQWRGEEGVSVESR